MQSFIVPNIKLIMEMIEKNIFRPLPVLKKVKYYYNQKFTHIKCPFYNNL